MKDLYNKILNEVLKVYDFDSWDNSESEFKTVINQQLNILFKYQYNPEIIKLIDNVDTAFSYERRARFYTARDIDFGKIVNKKWTEFSKYQDKIILAGKRVKLDKEGYIENLEQYINYNIEKDGLKESPILEIYIEDINEISSAENMFWLCSSLIAVSPGFNTSNIKSFQSMFCGCWCLQEVPALDAASCINYEHMFWGCKLLQNVPMFKHYKPGTYRQSGMFRYCASLNEKTLETWGLRSIKDNWNNGKPQLT